MNQRWFKIIIWIALGAMVFTTLIMSVGSLL